MVRFFFYRDSYQMSLLIKASKYQWGIDLPCRPQTNLPLHPDLDSPTLPPVQVFDKTLTVKQMHVLEPQDLLIVRADKGKICVVFIWIWACEYERVRMWVEDRIWNDLSEEREHEKERDQSKAAKETPGLYPNEHL